MELLPPIDEQGHWMAADRHATVEVRFAGRGAASARQSTLERVGGQGLELAWCRQIHSDRSLDASPGECGEADALITRRTGLALCVATADCVPVVVAASGALAAIHAGWRGIAAGIVGKTVSTLAAAGPMVAWLGPAIGPCCYEVDDDVAAAVVGASSSAARLSHDQGKPHLDLHRAVRDQLADCGVDSIRRVDTCTRCHAEALSSYRRDGKAAGRNLTFAWLRG